MRCKIILHFQRVSLGGLINANEIEGRTTSFLKPCFDQEKRRVPLEFFGAQKCVGLVAEAQVLSNNSNDRAQPVRRHQRRAHHLQQEDPLQDRHRHQRRCDVGKPQVRPVHRQ